MERSMEQTQTEKEIGELQLQLAETDKLRADNSRLNNNINTLQTQLADLRTKCENLESSNQGLALLQGKLESQQEEHSNLVAILENNIDKLETDLAKANQDALVVSECNTKREAESSAQVALLEREAERLREQLVSAETKADERITKLESQLGEVRSWGSILISCVCVFFFLQHSKHRNFLDFPPLPVLIPYNLG